MRWASHSSGDFEFAKLFRFSDHATERVIEALKNGANIVTNVNMM
ncbi:precorrin-8X methylmutase [Ferrimonas lipolytica]|uniref:Precorrin-8X methylmutase n=1 Tax=Ferrimonas lipolytica TaxID=2724191 RepID=A0A6H1UH14_9GAMM|nr:precorrin-8X methylmutase [Ferrimonas lipolytica]QIZ78334.1 precorrin-8X methylmutase [Ferrimonas lipolytica]